MTDPDAPVDPAADRRWKHRADTRWKHQQWRAIILAAVTVIGLALILTPLISDSDSTGPETSSISTFTDAATTGVRAEVTAATNKARAGHCKPLTANSKLTRSAQRHAADMARRNYFAHDTKGGRSWDERIEAAGYHGDTIGENIAVGQNGPREVVNAWMASPGHKRNILDCSFHYVGIGYQSDGRYWVSDFGGR